MHRYYKKLRVESSLPSNSTSVDSSLNQESDNDCTQTQPSTNDAHTGPSTRRSAIDVSAHPSDPGERKPNSVHNQCVKKCEDLMTQRQSIQTAFQKQSDQAKSDYRTRLTASIDMSRLLLLSGLPFRGDDESKYSDNRGHFLTFLEFHAEKNDNVGRVVLKNAPGNNQMTSPSIQKEIASACSKETIKLILDEIGDGYFSILADESRDASCKEQMAIVLRYVDRKGFVMERFVGLVHVSSTTAVSLKNAIYSILAQLSLSPSRLRGQGYDGTSNMRGQIHGLRSLILQDNPSAHYVHCFAHQLQLTLVAVAHNHPLVNGFLDLVHNTLNMVGGSYKRRDLYRECQAERVEEALRIGEIQTGKGLNQEVGLQRPGDSRWGSHFKTFVNLIVMFAPIVDVLDALVKDKPDTTEQRVAQGILDGIQTFDFAFLVHMMKLVLSITDSLSQALQRRDQNIANAIALLHTAKGCLQDTRDEGWDSLMDEVTSFCVKHDIDIPNMEDLAPKRARGKSKRRLSSNTNEHYYRVEVLYSVLDMQMQELNNCFTEVTTDLLLGLASLNPVDSFSNYDKNKIIKMARCYPDDFDEADIVLLGCELDNFIKHMLEDDAFSNLSGLGVLSRKLIATKKHMYFPRVYLLLKLALLLPVSTATVERAFSAMKHIKTDLRTRISDDFLNDAAVTYFERDLFKSISNDDIINRFQNMKVRRGQLD